MQCSHCEKVKAIIPSFLLGEKGIGSFKTKRILELLIESELMQKEIARQVGVSEATVTRVKQRSSSIDTGEIISEIIKSVENYPTSELINKSPQPSACKKIKYNLSLLKKLRKAKIIQTKSKIIKRMNVIQYYNLFIKNQKFIIARKE